MGTLSQTNTFTATDIRRVIDSFASDYWMISQSTGLRTRAQVDEHVADLKLFAEYGFLTEINLILWDSSGTKVRARKYATSDNASGWPNDLPGDNLWPRLQGATLQLIAAVADTWWAKSEAERLAFRTRTGIRGLWGSANVDTSFASMTPTNDRRYSSNGYGLQRTTFK
jgi:hypothetical protein